MLSEKMTVDVVASWGTVGGRTEIAYDSPLPPLFEIVMGVVDSRPRNTVAFSVAGAIATMGGARHWPFNGTPTVGWSGSLVVSVSAPAIAPAFRGENVTVIRLVPPGVSSNGAVGAA